VAGQPINSDGDYEKQFGYGISTFYGRGGTHSDPNARRSAGDSSAASCANMTRRCRAAGRS